MVALVSTHDDCVQVRAKAHPGGLAAGPTGGGGGNWRRSVLRCAGRLQVPRGRFSAGGKVSCLFYTVEPFAMQT